MRGSILGALCPDFCLQEFSDHLNELVALSERRKTISGEDAEVRVTTPMPCSMKQSTPNEMSTSSTVGSSEKETEQQHSGYDSMSFLPPKKPKTVSAAGNMAHSISIIINFDALRAYLHI